MERPSAIPDDALEAIAYLARSDNRVRILDTLTTGPHTRRQLEAATGTARTTCGRTLTELEKRGWVDRTSTGEFVATPTGDHIAEAFRRSVGAMATIQELGEIVAWLPVDELSIGLHHFREATVRRPAPTEPAEAGWFLAEALRKASTLAALTFVAPPRAVGDAIREDILDGSLTADLVMAGGTIDYLRDNPTQPIPWRECLEAGISAYRYDGSIPCNVFIVDETVLVLKSHSEIGEVGTAIESRSPTVHAWAQELIESYRDEADRVPADAFAEEEPGTA